eukprot:Tbor_TRINITY_DN3212_c0_g1::TRINITY_DN3212_c0_g1_i1::g.23788::m.23788
MTNHLNSAVFQGNTHPQLTMQQFDWRVATTIGSSTASTILTSHGDSLSAEYSKGECVLGRPFLQLSIDTADKSGYEGDLLKGAYHHATFPSVTLNGSRPACTRVLTELSLKDVDILIRQLKSSLSMAEEITCGERNT